MWNVSLARPQYFPFKFVNAFYQEEKSKVASISSNIGQEPGADVHEPNLTGFNKAALQKKKKTGQMYKVGGAKQVI